MEGVDGWRCAHGLSGVNVNHADECRHMQPAISAAVGTTERLHLVSASLSREPFHTTSPEFPCTARTKGIGGSPAGEVRSPRAHQQVSRQREGPFTLSPAGAPASAPRSAGHGRRQGRGVGRRASSPSLRRTRRRGSGPRRSRPVPVAGRSGPACSVSAGLLGGHRVRSSGRSRPRARSGRRRRGRTAGRCPARTALPRFPQHAPR